MDYIAWMQYLDLKSLFPIFYTNNGIINEECWWEQEQNTYQACYFFSALSEFKRGGKNLECDTSAERLMEILWRTKFTSGQHVDFFDEI